MMTKKLGVVKALGIFGLVVFATVACDTGVSPSPNPKGALNEIAAATGTAPESTSAGEPSDDASREAVGSGSDISDPSATTAVKATALAATSNPMPWMSANYSLRVPWMKQVPPGDWDRTKNCGPAVATMLRGYYLGIPATTPAMVGLDSWLAQRFNDPRYNDPNGWYTHFTSSRNELGTLLTERLGLRYSLLYGSSDFSGPVYQLSIGRPPIAGVMVSGGNLVASGGVAHWVLIVGWNGLTRTVYVNDPVLALTLIH